MNREHNEVEEKKTEKLESDERELLDITKLIDDAFKGLCRYWTTFLLIVSVSASLFYFQAKQSYEPVYQASMTFIVNTNTAVSYSQSYYNKATASQIAKTFPYIISNSALQHIIAEDLGVQEIPGEIEASAMSDTNMITVSVKSDSPEQAYEILQSVIKNYPEVARRVIGETELNVVDETGIPVAPVNGNGARSSAKRGFVFGVLICLIWLFLYSVTRKTIQREDDFKRVLNVKCLGSIPKVKFKKRSSISQNQLLIGSRRVSYGFTESIRTIRTRVERDAAEKGARIYMISSAIAGEGKSTVAANLALSLAGKGQKVILVDMDLRNPSVRKTLGIEEQGPGLSDIVTGEITVPEVMIKYKETGLQVLPGGSPVNATAKILRDPKLGRLFALLRRNADYVIVDTSPSSLLADAAELVTHMDAGVFVVRQDYAPVDRILDGIEMLTDTGLRLAGCVLNGAEVGITGYGYGYGYGYGGYGRYGKYGKYGSKYTSGPAEEEEQDAEQERSE